MSCSFRRYMSCYYIATLFVLSLDNNTIGLHVNLLAGGPTLEVQDRIQ